MNETCEGYVVNKLKETEEENQDLKEKVKDLVEENTRLSATLVTIKDILRRRARIDALDGGSRYITMTIWARTWDPENLADYETLLSLVDIPFKEEEKEEETEEEDGNE